MKKLILIFALLLLAVSGFFVYKKLDSKDFFMSKEERFFYQKLKEFKESGKDSIALKELTNFEWENVCDIQPYSGNPNFEKLNLKLDKDLPHADDDTKFALIFINRKHGRVFIFNRGNSYPQLTIGNCPYRDEALIRLQSN